MKSFEIAAARLFRPLARLLIARGIHCPDVLEWMKDAYLTAAERHFRVGTRRLTDSRMHLLTGLPRREIKALRAHDSAEPPVSAGPLPRIVALWLAGHTDAKGTPRALPRQGDAPSFEALVGEVSRQIHPRTVLDELIRLGLAHAEDDAVHLTEAAFVPTRDEAALLNYFGANLGDHVSAATGNVLASPEPAPHFERAVHYNHLSEAALDELDALSRKLLGEALNKVNARAAALQRRDRGKPEAKGRFRAGAYLYAETDETSPEGPAS